MEPVTSLYVPGGHRLQATPSQAAVYPAKHLQAVMLGLTSEAVIVFGGHWRQLLSFGAAGLVPYWPYPQWMHMTVA